MWMTTFVPKNTPSCGDHARLWMGVKPLVSKIPANVYPKPFASQMDFWCSSLKKRYCMEVRNNSKMAFILIFFSIR